MHPTAAASCAPVLAADDLPQGTFSDEFSADVLLRPRRREESSATVEVRSSGGRLRVAGQQHGGGHYGWVRVLPLADDCHSCNLLLHCRGDGLVLLVVRHVRRGEPLLLWLSEPLLARCSVPFLAPCNIQGENRYVCHNCGRLFGVPNPLKIHLALSCDSLNISCLWSRLKDPGDGGTGRQSVADYPLLLSAGATRPLDAPRLGDLLPHCRYPGQERFTTAPLLVAGATSPLGPDALKARDRAPGAAHHGSAFRPYGKRRPGPLTTTTTTISSTTTTAARLSGGLVLAPLGCVLAPTTTPPPTPRDVFNRQAAAMETLVSNLGRSGHGHLCIYCGKVYSRKYGLKIHIRTHTGYKPLSCKVCLRPFGDPSNLNKHVRLHSGGETPYKCEQCGKVLVRRRDLERHLKSRHSPFLCPAADMPRSATNGQS